MRREVERIFHEVADLGRGDRLRYFDEHGAGADTRREVEALIAFDATSIRALEHDIGQLALAAVANLEPDGLPCGAYHLLESLGSGGMGAVYLAERNDGEVAQRVAVKLLRPGANDPQHRRRFLDERQILAGLSHQHIARLLDAGHRADGQPYLVMEYVAGKTIDIYAADLTIRQKVALFVKVCSAVAYLHRNLVVHRDLKPANIMVTEDGEPKLLDFGIAKILDLSADSTVTDMRVLTPDYASPEQVLGEPITTATDIYSLGAVLYKLLTGASPHQFQGESAMSIAFSIASGKVTPPSRLAPELRGDLEIVLMKALRAEPHERYPSVDAFADDLRACLEWRPVQARSGDVWYRTRRLLRRYWVPATAAAVVVGSLSGGLYLANRQRVIAERRFAQLRQLSRRVIDIDGAIRALPGSVDARQRLVAASLAYLEGLYPEAHNNLELTQEISDGYWRLARIQGVNAEPNLGDTKKAEESLKKAEALIETVLAAHPHDRGALFRSAVIAQDRGILADTDDRRADFLAHARQATERLEAFLREGTSGPPVRLEGFMRPGDPRESEIAAAGTVFTNVAIGYVNAHAYEEGARCARRGAELAAPYPQAGDTAGQALSIMANALRYQGDLEGALSAIRQARQRLEHFAYTSPTARLFTVYAVKMREGRILGEEDAVNLGRPEEAIQVLQSALDMVEGLAQSDPNDSASRGRVATSARELGDILRNRDPQRALAVYDLGIQRLTQMKSSLKARRDRAQLLAGSAYPLRQLHRTAEAGARIDAAFALLRETHDYPAQHIGLGGYVYSVACALADHQAATGKTAEALGTYREVLAKIEAKSRPEESLAEAVHMSRLYSEMAGLNRRLGLNGPGDDLEARRRDLWRRWEVKLPNNSFVRRQLVVVNRDSESN